MDSRMLPPIGLLVVCCGVALGAHDPGHHAGHELVYGCWGDEHGRLEGGRFLVPVGPVPVDGAGMSGLRSRGVGDNRVDLVIVGDGYTVDDMPQYHLDAANISEDFFRYEPFTTYRPYFRITVVEVVSNESGVDNDPTQGIFRDTAMDMRFWCNGTERLLCVNVTKAWNYALGGADDVDQILAVANSSKYGGAGYSSSNLGTVSGQNAASVEVAIHEMGHSLGNLADEYTYGGPSAYNGSEPSTANLSIYQADQMLSQERKWHEWLGASVSGFDGLTWTYEGGGYSQTGIYRPSNNSMMRSLNRPFNLPSAEQLIKEIYREVSPIDAAPVDGSEFGPGDVITVTPMQPGEGHSLTVLWYLDGGLLAVGSGESTVDVSGLGLSGGEHTLEVVVVDETPWVIDEAIRDAYLTDSRLYTVTGCTASADLNGDGVFDLQDISAFITAFVAGDAAADLAAPFGVLDLADVTAFVGAFVSGC